MVLDVDVATRRLTVRPVAAASPAGKSYELWIIDPAIGPPRSLGLVAAVAGSQASLKAYDPAVITDASTNSSQVFFIRDGKARVGVIQLGAPAGDSVQILSGLPANAVVALDHLQDLYDGQAVKTVEKGR